MKAARPNLSEERIPTQTAGSGKTESRRLSCREHKHGAAGKSVSTVK
jgi:hypothetical protein